MVLQLFHPGDNVIASPYNINSHFIEGTCSKGSKKYSIPKGSRLQIVDMSKILTTLIGVNDNGYLKYVSTVDIKKYDTHIKKMRLVLYCLQEKSIHIFVCQNTETDLFDSSLHNKLDLADEVLRGKWEFPIHDMINHDNIMMNIMEMVHKFTGIFGTQHSKELFELFEEKNVGDEKVVFVEFKGDVVLFKELFGEAPTKKDPLDVLKTTKGKVRSFSTFTSLQVEEYQKNRVNNKNQNFFTEKTLRILQKLFETNKEFSKIPNNLILPDTEGFQLPDTTKLTLKDINLSENAYEDPVYKNKYLKYKQKYLNLKNSFGGNINDAPIVNTAGDVKKPLTINTAGDVKKPLTIKTAAGVINAVKEFTKLNKFNLKIDHVRNIIPFINEIYAYDSNKHLVIIPNEKIVRILKLNSDHTAQVEIDGREFTISFYNLDSYYKNRLIDECA